MPNKTKKSKNTKKTKQQAWVISTIVLLVALCIALIAGVTKQAHIINHYESIAQLDNQACRYLSNRGEDYRVNGGFTLNVDAKDSEAKLTYYCLTGDYSKDKTIHSKPITGYAFGATVKYFSSEEAAENYAKEKLNPLRYWRDDDVNRIQDKNYTFIVTDEKQPYFDAYRVRKNAVVRVSLQCKSMDPGACEAQANKLLDQELKGISADNL